MEHPCYYDWYETNYYPYNLKLYICGDFFLALTLWGVSMFDPQLSADIQH